MLQTVIFRSLKPDVYPDLTIPVVDSSPTQPLILRNITGLEPVSANINSKGYGGLDGEFFVGSEVGKRNIVMTFGLNTSGGYASVSHARDLVYGYMEPKAAVWLRFLTDDHVPVEIRGLVESITSDRFTDDPSMQVSIICVKPNLLAATRTEITGVTGTDPDEVEIIYNGNRETGIGVILEIGDYDYVGEVILETRIAEPVYQTFSLYDDTWFSKDDQLWISTEQGAKYVNIHRPNVDDEIEVINMLGKMNSSSWWIYLVQGRNLFRILTPNSNRPRNWTMAYTEQYGGV